MQRRIPVPLQRMEKRIQHHNRDIQQRGEVALRELEDTAKSAPPITCPGSSRKKRKKPT
jgi:hypothetical protein